MEQNNKVKEAKHSEELEKQEEQEQEQVQKIWSWGAGTDGQLCTGRLQDEHLPQLLHHLHLPSISLLACGGAHVIALTSGGKVFTWGRGTSGQLGHGDMVNTLYPKVVSSLEDYFITHVSAGWNHSGFVSDGGCVFTCGDGSFGQLGHGDYRSHCSPVRVSYFVNKHVERIACGMRHSLVLLKGNSGNQIYAFGSGKRGQLGISKDKVKLITLPEVTYGLEDVKIVSIAANGDHSAALSVDGCLYTWGRGFSGTPDAQFPQCLPSSLRFTTVAVGWNHALALTGDGEVFMLGGNYHGALGDLEKMSPAKQLPDSREAILEKVPGLNGIKIVQIAAGAEHSAVVTENGEIKTWGWGEHGQLGLGNTCDQISPQSVSLSHNPNEAATYELYCGSGFTFAIMNPCDPSQT
ncbi:ultraviolet-B receptor UVR8 isoform X2 [Fagus crenata]